MADTVSKKNNDDFIQKAKAHQDHANHTREMLSQHQALREQVLDALQASSLSETVPHLIEWWENFHRHTLNYAELHDQISDHLNTTHERFDETDSQIKRPFDAEAPGFSS